MGDVLVAQLSDIHFGIAADHGLWGRDPSAALAKVCDAVRAVAPDLALLTGDLTDAGDVESTRYVAATTRDLAPVVRWLAGNHDRPSSLAQVEPTWTAPAVVGEWTVIPIESWVENEWFGRLTDTELARIEALLSDLSTPYALLAVHQPPLGMCDAPGCVLETPEALLAMVARHAAVRVVVSGHQHNAFTHVHEGVTYAGAGSTCTQLEHIGDGFAPLENGPMYTLLHLGADGSVRVQHEECALVAHSAQTTTA